MAVYTGNRLGLLVVYLKYPENRKDRHLLPSTVSVECYLNQVQTLAASILNIKKAKEIVKVTYNSRIINLN